MKLNLIIPALLLSGLSSIAVAETPSLPVIHITRAPSGLCDKDGFTTALYGYVINYSMNHGTQHDDISEFASGSALTFQTGKVTVMKIDPLLIARIPATATDVYVAKVTVSPSETPPSDYFCNREAYRNQSATYELSKGQQPNLVLKLSPYDEPAEKVFKMKLDKG